MGLGLKKLMQPSFRRGLYLEEADLWMDPYDPKPFAFVSHGHADHFARHEQILCSTGTGGILNARYKVAKKRLVMLDFYESMERDGYRITLLPAGHILGSAMIHVTEIESGATMLYTGDFKMRAGRTSEQACFRQADVLIMETTFARPHYVFPPQSEIEQQIVRFATAALEDGDVPILLGYSLGKAQEIIAILLAHDIPVVQHPTVAEMTRACRKAGADLPEPVTFDQVAVPAGHALVAPPHAVRAHKVRKMKNQRMAMCSGWALQPAAKYRYRVDEVICLSDHADHPGLLEAVQRVRPKLVLTQHGSARDFARELRKRGVEAWSSFGNDQLELEMGGEGAERKRQHLARPVCGWMKFSRLCEQVDEAQGRLDKVGQVADYLRTLDDSEVRLAAQWLTGRAFARRSGVKALSIGSAAIRQMILQVTGLSLARYREVSQRQADSARTARILLQEAPLRPREWSLGEVDGLLLELAEAKGSLRKVEMLAEALREMHPIEGSRLVSLLTGDLRIGLKEGLVEDAVAKAFSNDDRDLSRDVRRANMLLGDLGEVAVMAAQGRLDEAKMRPHIAVKPMLASPEEDADGIYDRLSATADEQGIWLEDKYDGIRAQLHVTDGRVSLFSRDGRSLEGDFPEVLEGGEAFFDDVIIDGEIIAYADGKRLTFFDLQKRLGRKKGQGDLFLGGAVPVRFVIFDLLWADGETLMEQPLRERRKRMEQLALPEGFELIEVVYEKSAEEIDEAFQASRRRGNEGLIAKDPASTYSPGRRGKQWLKLKKAQVTLDCVVVKAQQGHGKRAEWLSDYTFALRDEATGELATLGKAYSGLTDVEIEQLTEHFLEKSVGKKGRVHDVEPDTVLEIAFDSIQPSKRYNSGLSLRFPRIKAIRHDKTPEDIDTLAYAKRLAGVQI